MKIQCRIIILLILLSATVYGDGPEKDYPKIKAIVNPTSSTIGAPVDYRVNIVGKDLKNIEILLPEKKEFYPDQNEDNDINGKKKDANKKNIKKPSVKADDKNSSDDEDPGKDVPLYVIHSAKKEDKSDSTMGDITVVMQLSFYRPGKYTLPEIELKGADKIKISYKIPEIEIKELNPKGELMEIEPPLDLGGNYYRLIFLLLGVAALTALVIFLVRYYKKKKEEKLNAPVIVRPIEVFQKEINALAGSELIAAGKIEEYVFGISMIFRKFLSLQFHIDATDMTSDEIEKILKKLASRELYMKYNDMIMRCMQLWDLSKFAEFAPSAEILYTNLDMTIKLAENISRDMDNVTDRI